MFKGNFTVFDFETTGLNPIEDRVIEVAAVKFKEGIPVDSYSTLVNPNRKLSSVIVNLTGLTDEVLRAEGISELDMFRNLVKFMGKDLLVAHNAVFDLGFLYYGLNRLFGLRDLNVNVIDTLTIARHNFFYPHKLENLASANNITLNNAHRALSDVMACGDFLIYCSKNYSLSKYLNRIGYNKKYGRPSYYIPKHITLIAQELKYNNGKKSMPISY